MKQFFGTAIFLTSFSFCLLANQPCEQHEKKVQTAFSEKNYAETLTLTQQERLREISCDSNQLIRLLSLRVRAKIKESGFAEAWTILQKEQPIFVAYNLTAYYDLHYFLAKTFYDQQQFARVIQFLDKKINWTSLHASIDKGIFADLVMLKGISLRKMGQVETARILYEETLPLIPEENKAFEMLRQNLLVTYENLYLLDSLYNKRRAQLATAEKETDSERAHTLKALSLTGLSLVTSRLERFPKAIELQNEALQHSKAVQNHHLTAQIYHDLFLLHIKNKEVENARIVLDSLEKKVAMKQVNFEPFRLPWLKSKLNFLAAPQSVKTTAMEQIVENWEAQAGDVHGFAFVLLHYLEILVYQKADCATIQTISDEIKKIANETGNLEIGYALYQHFDKIKPCLQQEDYLYFLQNNEQVAQKIKQVQGKLLAEDFSQPTAEETIGKTNYSLFYLMSGVLLLLAIGLLFLFKRKTKTASSNQQDFVKSLEHDLTKPLKNLVAQSDENSELDKADLQKAVDGIRQNIRRYAQLFDIDNEPITRANLNLRQLVEDVISEFQIEQFTKLYIPKNVELKTDILLLRQVFYNLIDNAIRFSKVPNQPQIAIRATKKETLIIIEMTDKGIGFDANQSATELFKKGKTFHANHPATNMGMGLYLVKKIIKKLGGTVAIQAKINEGTRVELTLPKG